VKNFGIYFLYLIRLKFRYEQLNLEIRKFDANLKKEKISKLMKEILYESESSKVSFLE
jgi:hypothetical protein